MEVYLPDRLYFSIPHICAMSATVGMFLDASVIKWLCVIALYSYACWVWYMRSDYRAQKVEARIRAEQKEARKRARRKDNVR